MATGQDEFKFPDEVTGKDVEFGVEKDSETEVEIVDDTPEADRNRTPMREAPADVTDEELAAYSDSVKQRIQHFSKGYHEERRAKEAAQREKEEALSLARQLLDQNQQLKTNVGQNQTALLAQAKNVVAAEVAAAKQKLKEAHDSFDTDAIVAAQEALLAAKIKADRVNNFKLPPVQKPETAVQSAPANVPSPPPPIEPRVAKWQDNNAWFGQDEEMTAVALTVHRKLVQDGVDPKTEEYYNRIDQRMRQVFPDAFPQEKNGKTTRSVVAPATRSTAPKKIVLTQSQVNIARKLNVPLAEYAKQVANEMRKNNA